MLKVKYDLHQNNTCNDPTLHSFILPVVFHAFHIHVHVPARRIVNPY